MSSVSKENDSSSSHSLLTNLVSQDGSASQSTECERENLPLLVETPTLEAPTGASNTIPPFTNNTEDPLGTQTNSELCGYVKPQKENVHKKEPGKLGVQVQNKKVPSRPQLVVPKDSPLIKRHWITTQGSSSPDSEGEDPMILVDKFNKALKEVTSAGKILQHCLVDNVDKHTDTKMLLEKRELELETSREENADLKLCEQEMHEYKEKCAKVAETERDMRKYYEDQLAHLKTQLKSLNEEKNQADKAHKCEVDSLERKHYEEKADLSYTMQLQSKYCQELEKELRERNSLSTKLKEKQDEVEELQETLKRKEQELKELERKVKTKAKEVETLSEEVELKESTIRECRLQTMTKETKDIEKQLERCQEIGELVRRLPSVTSQEDLEKITKQISDDITKMKAETTCKKSMSWR